MAKKMTPKEIERFSISECGSRIVEIEGALIREQKNPGEFSRADLENFRCELASIKERLTVFESAPC
jgi:hypothetical protein